MQCEQINNSACKIAKKVAQEKGTITAGGIAMTDIYQSTRNKEQTIAEIQTATKALIENDIDMIICEVYKSKIFLTFFGTMEIELKNSLPNI